MLSVIKRLMILRNLHKAREAQWTKNAQKKVALVERKMPEVNATVLAQEMITNLMHSA